MTVKPVDELSVFGMRAFRVRLAAAPRRTWQLRLGVPRAHAYRAPAPRAVPVTDIPPAGCETGRVLPSPRPVAPAADGPVQPAAAGRPGRALPAWLALVLAVLGGVGSAAQGAANAEIGVRVGAASMGAVVNNLGGTAIILVAVLLMPSLRSGLAVLWRARLPWWIYLGGLGGTFFLIAGTYAIPVLGVAVFTVAQVAGSSTGGLAVDRAGLAPVGRLTLTAPRVAGAVLAVGAVTLAQFGRPIGELATGSLLLAVGAGVAVAVQSAINARISAVGGTAAGTTVNFVVGTSAMLVAAALLGAFTRLGSMAWPREWYLYVGGALGVSIVVVTLVSVQAVGVLRTGLAVIAGQLGGAILLDTAVGGHPPSPAVVAGMVLTLAAVLVTGWRRGRRPARPGRLGP